MWCLRAAGSCPTIDQCPLDPSSGIAVQVAYSQPGYFGYAKVFITDASVAADLVGTCAGAQGFDNDTMTLLRNATSVSPFCPTLPLTPPGALCSWVRQLNEKVFSAHCNWGHGPQISFIAALPRFQKSLAEETVAVGGVRSCTLCSTQRLFHFSLSRFCIMYRRISD